MALWRKIKPCGCSYETPYEMPYEMPYDPCVSCDVRQSSSKPGSEPVAQSMEH